MPNLLFENEWNNEIEFIYCFMGKMKCNFLSDVVHESPDYVRALNECFHLLTLFSGNNFALATQKTTLQTLNH